MNINNILTHMLTNRQRMANVVTLSVYFYSMLLSFVPCIRNKKNPTKHVKMAKIYENAK